MRTAALRDAWLNARAPPPPQCACQGGQSSPSPAPAHPPSLPAPPASPRIEHREQRLEHPQFSSFLILKEARLSTCSRHRGLGQP